MKKKLNREQFEVWAREQRDFKIQRGELKRELEDVETLTPDFFLEALELDERVYQEPPMSLAELFFGFDWIIRYEDMMPDQQRILWEKVYEILGVDINTPILDSYSWIGDESAPGKGIATISVSATRYDGLALHHITYADGIVDIAIGRPPEQKGKP